jgi:hypothetical protein
MIAQNKSILAKTSLKSEVFISVLKLQRFEPFENSFAKLGHLWF